MIILVTLFIIQAIVCIRAEKRPLYVIGHMANTPDDVDSFLKLGANAIEADLQFNEITFQPNAIYHGFPCDCWRVCSHESAVNDFFSHMRDIATPGHRKYVPRFTGLLWIDIKLKVQTERDAKIAGAAIAKILMKTVYITRTNLKILFEIGTTAEWPVLTQVVNDILNAGRTDILSKLAFGVLSGAQNVNSFLKTAGDKIPIGGLFISSGTSNCFEMMFEPETHEALALRDQENSTVSKVYRWTIDKKSTIRHTLQMDIDGIISNDVEDVREVLRESEFAQRYRLATSEDDPFKRYVGSGGKRVGCSLKGYFWKELTCWRDTDLEENWCWTDTTCEDDASVCSNTLACE